MKYEFEFYLDENGNAVFPVITYVGAARSKYIPASAKTKVDWSEWRNAVASGRHVLMSHAVQSVSSTPEETVLKMLTAEFELDYDYFVKPTFRIEEMIYHA